MTQPASLGNYSPGARPDNRPGLGYGQSNPQKHVDRQHPSSFPYQEDDEYEDEDIADIPLELQKKLRKVINGYLASDYLAMKGTDPFYYTAGNTKLGENVTGKSLSPMPALYKKRTQAGGGVNSPRAFSPGSLQQTGSTIGYSHPHKSMGPDKDLYLDDLEDEEDLPIKKVRMTIRKILENEYFE